MIIFKTRHYLLAGLSVFILMIILQNPVFGQERNISSALSWYTDFDSAFDEADTTGKNMMLYFSGFDWCKPCIQLNKNILETNTFSAYATENFVPMKLDFPKMKKNELPKKVSSQNDLIAERYNPNGVFLLVFLDHDKKVIGFTGYTDVSPDIFVSIIEKIMTHG